MRFLDWVLNRVGLPAVAVGAMLLHGFAAVTAFNLADGMLWGFASALAVWATPVLGEIVVAHYAGQASGSVVNAYSFWLLVWVALFANVLVLGWVVRRVSASRAQTQPGIAPV